jgi:hypothetical protein
MHTHHLLYFPLMVKCFKLYSRDAGFHTVHIQMMSASKTNRASFVNGSDRGGPTTLAEVSRNFLEFSKADIRLVVKNLPISFRLHSS